MTAVYVNHHRDGIKRYDLHADGRMTGQLGRVLSAHEAATVQADALANPPTRNAIRAFEARRSRQILNALTHPQGAAASLRAKVPGRMAEVQAYVDSMAPTLERAAEIFQVLDDNHNGETLNRLLNTLAQDPSQSWVAPRFPR